MVLRHLLCLTQNTQVSFMTALRHFAPNNNLQVANTNNARELEVPKVRVKAAKHLLQYD